MNWMLLPAYQRLTWFTGRLQAPLSHWLSLTWFALEIPPFMAGLPPEKCDFQLPGGGLPATVKPPMLEAPASKDGMSVFSPWRLRAAPASGDGW